MPFGSTSGSSPVGASAVRMIMVAEASCCACVCVRGCSGGAVAAPLIDRWAIPAAAAPAAGADTLTGR